MAKKSKYGTWSWGDLGKGLVMSVLMSILTFAGQAYEASGNFDDINYGTLGKVAIGSLIAYLLKNLATNSDDKLLKKEPNKIDTDKP